VKRQIEVHHAIKKVSKKCSSVLMQENWDVFQAIHERKKDGWRVLEGENRKAKDPGAEPHRSRRAGPHGLGGKAFRLL